MSCCFVGLILIGRAVPGSVIAYFLVMLLMIGPGICIHLLPPYVVEKLKSLRTFFKMKGKGKKNYNLRNTITWETSRFYCYMRPVDIE
jgi:hypothetical protein